jgi:hypothetical protein
VSRRNRPIIADGCDNCMTLQACEAPAD